MNEQDVKKCSQLVVKTYKRVARKYIDQGIRSSDDALRDLLKKDPSLANCDVFMLHFPICFIAERDCKLVM